MAKSSHRPNTHVQPEKPGVPESAPRAEPKEDSEPVVSSENARGGLWIALLIWAFVFGFLFIWLLIDLVISFLFQ